MVKNIKLLLASGFLLFLVSCKCTPGIIGSLPVTLHPQETNMWCWAGSGQMVMDYLGNNVAQCTQANNRFGVNNCPCSQCGANPAANPPCVQGGWPEFDKYNFTFKTTNNAPLSWADLRKQVANNKYCGKKPFAFSWHWPGGGGHMMVVKGYVTVNNVDYVAILDPWAPCAGDEEIMTYDYYDESAGHHTHWNDYYDVTPKS